MRDVETISVGLCYLSVCVKIGTKHKQIEEAANLEHPTGISSLWHMSKDPAFANGAPNPCQCEDHADREHFLLNC